MPLFDFVCANCQTKRELFGSVGAVESISLVCTECGGSMNKGPSLFHAVTQRSSRKEVPSGGTSSAKSSGCGHRYACRCAGLKLTRPNPLQKQVDAALAKPDAE